MTQNLEAHLPSPWDAFCRSLRCLQHECGLRDISLIPWMLRFAVLLQTLTHTALCCCLYFQGFFMMTLCDNSVMKICRAVCSSCFYVFGTCLFSCCVSEVFFLLYFLFFFLLLILGKRSVKKVSHVPRAREGSCLQAHFAFLSGGLSQDGAFVWKRFSTSRAGSASRERRGFQARADPSIAT